MLDKPPRDLKEGEIWCPHCGWIWRPRVADPVSCVHCKRALKLTPYQQKKRLDRQLKAMPTVDETNPLRENKSILTCHYDGNPIVARVTNSDGSKISLCKTCLVNWAMERKQLTMTELFVTISEAL